MNNRKKISLLGIVAAGVALLGAFGAHAQINTGIEFGSATGLASTDIRTTVGRIIQVFLGILGVVALVLIVYAGFLWMTAGGNDEQVTRAKKIMTQAVIGLAIILASFAITSYVVSQLVAATGGNEGGAGGGGGGGGGSLGGGQFAVASITPPGDKAADFKWPKNSQIRVILKNGMPDPTTSAGSISVTADGAAVSGTISTEGNTLVFAATAKCVENPAYTCLPGNAAIAVSIAPTIKSLSGSTLTCGLCSASFATSDLIDVQNPTVAIVSPPDGASVSANSFVPIIADPHDDFAVAGVEFFANDVSLGSVGAPWQTDWDTTGIPAGTTVKLAATATDASGNTGLAQPVSVTVRPEHCFNNVQDGGETGLNCGDGCGACGGGSCTQASDCASGLCVSGHCVNRPRIDSVTPLAGGPGTLVSIKGASFGSAPGEVMFLGAPAAGDEKVAAPCAPSAWSDTQIVVGVPEGAVTGPLQVTNRDNYSDRTDDDFGNAAIPNFTVNTAVVPGICTLTPNFGPTGTSVVISGNGFGDTQGAGNVAVASRAATVQSWSGTQITMTTPNLLGGVWPVTVTAANIDSNNVGFTVPVSAATGPHLLSVDQASGPVGQYITLTGTGLGSSPGKVEFVSGAFSKLGGVDFPPVCGNAYWNDTTVTVKVPGGLPMGDVDLKLTRADAVPADNTLPFTIVAGNPSAGICRITPSSGPVGITYEIDGERLGNDRGKVIFRNNVDGSTSISSWNDGSVAGAVPSAAVTGRVFAVSAAASVSNALNFEVADCRKAPVCSGSEECCGDGACRLPNADGSSGCQAMKTTASYRYRFSTGDIPLVPQVVEEITCALRSQSPSPYKSVADACANSVASVRFTVPMDHATLNKNNFKVLDCGSAAAFDAASCNSSVAGVVSAFGANQTLDDGMQFNAGGLKPNEWYQGTISKTVASSAGVLMDNDYVWHFRVRNSPDPCEIASVTVAPAVNRLTDIFSDAADHDINENVTWSAYRANPADDVCNVLDCTPYVWNWQAPNQTGSVGIVNPTICTPEVRALAETTGSTPADITATAQNKTGLGELTIKFAAPEVIDKWPACQAACLNAQVAASFNVAVTNVSNNTVKFFSCNNETCSVSTPVAGYTVEDKNDGTEHLAIIHPSAGGLAANQFYRVVVLGGAAGVLSIPGAELVKTNDVYGADLTPAVSWIFRTTDQRCAIDHIGMEPPSIYTKIIDSFHSITAVPVSAPDSCSKNGERLDESGLGLAWGVAPVPGAAELYAAGALNTRPLASSTATSVCLNAGSARKQPVCGNGIIENGQGDPKASASQGGEECDLGAANGQKGSGCSTNCLLTGEGDKNCGNGKPDSYTLGDGSTVQEQCDLGASNSQPGSGCSASCLREGSDASTPPSTCGNGDLADSEQCDDGNAVSGDGCSSNCLDEGSQPGSFAVCGNGEPPEPGEDCDAGAANGKAGSGCSTSCLFTGSSACSAKGQNNCCGNGITDAGEAPGCDGGWNPIAGAPNVAEGCDRSCRKVGASVSYSTPSVCGDGIVGIGETNDPGGGASGNIDATQFAKAVGLGTTLNAENEMISTITAAAGGKNGQAEFALQCGYTDASQCPSGMGLAANSCCYPLPHVVAWMPQGVNVCRNPLISAEFDRPMDEASFSGKLIVTSPAPASGVCPSNKVSSTGFIKKLFAGLEKVASKLIAFLTGRSAEAAPSNCAIPIAVSVDTRLVNGVKHSFASVALSSALAAGTPYTVTIDGSVKTVEGVKLGAPFQWTFTTGSDICTLDELDVAPASYLFTSQYSANVADPNASQTFASTALHFTASGASEQIAPITGTYAWTTGWKLSSEIKGIMGAITNNAITAFPDKDSVAGTNVTVGVMKADNGEGTLAAAAKITDDTINTPSTKGDSLVGTADLTIMLCKKPWPARSANGSWAPAQNQVYNYSFYYCRDAADSTSGDLPALTENPSSPKNMPTGTSGEYLYTYVNTLGAEGVGIRVANNPLHLSAAEWYASQGFKGNLTSTTVDGYDAVQDGSTIYVNAPALNVPTSATSSANYTNIYILSSSVGAGHETQNIFGQIIKNMRFVANRDASGNLIYNDLNICSGNSGVSCSNDLDCAGGICLVDRSKIRRDVKRLSDLRLIAEAAAKVHDATGAYPALPSGSFVPGNSVSTWPSWGKEFAQELGGAPPADPLNKMAACPSGSDYEAGTCWSPSTQSAVCPIGSHVYSYSNFNGNSTLDRSGAHYGYSQEAKGVIYVSHCDTPNITAAQCQADPLCAWYDKSTSGFTGCATRVDIYCNGGTLSATAPVCGDGQKTGEEQCEKSVSPTQTIGCGSNLYGSEVDNCGADCMWIKGACLMPKCGNGIKETGETCDQGPLNGTYGHCNAACTGIGKSCGDGNVDQGEVCDNGTTGKSVGGNLYPPNGAWSVNPSFACSFDCHSHGSYCGDGIVTAPDEQCDGNTQTSNDPAVTGQTACGSFTDAKGHVYSQARTITCDSQCHWNQWAAVSCLPTGSCGNGIKDPGEECDDGSANSDTGACTTACKQNACGDGLVYSGREQCDEGAKNIDPNATGAANAIQTLRGNCNLQSCYYCSNTCTVKAVSGSYCGDGLPSSTKQCDDGAAKNVDPKKMPYCNDPTGANCTACSQQCLSIVGPHCSDGIVNGPEQCDNGAANVDPSDTAAIAALGQGAGYCTTSCTNATAPICGNGTVEPGELCDAGTGNVSSANPPYCANSTASSCTMCSDRCQNIIDPYCGDGVKNGSSEQCDCGSSPGKGDGQCALGSQNYSSALAAKAGVGANKNYCTNSCIVAVSSFCGDGHTDPGEQCDNGNSNYSSAAAALAGGVAHSASYCNTSCQTASTSAAPRCGDGNVDPGEQCDNGNKNYSSISAAQSAGVPSNTQFCTTSCALLTTPAPAPVCGNGIKESGEQCDLGSRNGGSGCSYQCSCMVEEFVSDAATMAGSAPAVAQSDSYISAFAGGWATLPNAKYLWSFDESNIANDPADWQTASQVVTFTRTFTLSNPVKQASLQLTADNNIISVAIDGTDITSQVGGPMNSFANIYSVDISANLQGGLTHTLTITANNTPNGQSTATNPAMLIFRIVSSPACSS